MVMERLKNVDNIAYIRFASVYREFADITALKQAVDTLVSGQAEVPRPTSQLPLLPDEDLKVLTGSHNRDQRKKRVSARELPGNPRSRRLS